MESKFPIEINKQKIFGLIAAVAVGLIVLLAAMVIILREQDDVSGIYPTRDNSIYTTQPGESTQSDETTQPSESTLPTTEVTVPPTLPDDPEDPQPSVSPDCAYGSQRGVGMVPRRIQWTDPLLCQSVPDACR